MISKRTAVENNQHHELLNEQLAKDAGPNFSEDLCAYFGPAESKQLNLADAKQSHTTDRCEKVTEDYTKPHARGLRSVLNIFMHASSVIEPQSKGETLVISRTLTMRGVPQKDVLQVTPHKDGLNISWGPESGFIRSLTVNRNDLTNFPNLRWALTPILSKYDKWRDR